MVKNQELILTKEAALKLKYFVELVDGEISGFGKIKLDKDKNIVVDDIIVFKQTVTSGSTILDSGAIAQFYYGLQKNNLPVDEWKLWWHSHATMQTFWSATDDKTIKDFAESKPYIVSLVTNKAGEYKSRLDVFPKDSSPFKKITYSTYDLETMIEDNGVIDEKTQKQIDELEDIILKTLDQKKKLEDKLQGIIDTAEEKLNSLAIMGQEDEAIKALCQKEIKEKVTNQIIIKTGYNKNTIKRKKSANSKWDWWEDRKYDNLDLSPKPVNNSVREIGFRSDSYDDGYGYNSDYGFDSKYYRK